MNQNTFQQYLIITLASLRVSSELTRQLLLSERLRHEKKMVLNQLDRKINNFLKVVDIDMREDAESLKKIDLVHEAMAEIFNEIIDKNEQPTKVDGISTMQDSLPTMSESKNK